MIVLITDEIELYSEMVNLNEDVVYNANKDKYIIAIDPSPTYRKALLKDPYFKVYEGNSYRTAERDIRFHIKDGLSDKHKDGKKELKVTNKLIDWIAETMSKPTTLKKYSGITVYDAIWKVLYECASSDPIIEYVPLDEFLRRLYEKNYK